MSLAVVEIADPDTGATAKIAPTLGFNCFSFVVPHAKSAIETLYADPGFLTGETRPTRTGIPLLFPFPGRIRGATYTWQGKAYQLEGSPNHGGHAIHGFCNARPWRVIEQSSSKVTGEFHGSIDAPQTLERWPSDYRIRATYEVDGLTLRGSYAIDNPGDQPMPFGFGTHPYFRVPLGGPSADACLVSFPISREWQLENTLPTGRKIEPSQAKAFREGVPFGDLKIDAVFTDLTFHGDWSAGTVFDPGSGLRTTVSWDRSFRECVVFTPDTRQSVCIEPYSCVPDFFELEERGVETGMQVLRPGESTRFIMEVRLD